MSTSVIPDSKTALSRLAEATAGLLYISESDAPFELAQLPPGTANFTIADACNIAGEPAAPVEQVSIEDFFAGPTKSQNWHEEQEKADVARYCALKSIFAEQLSSSCVFRVGAVRVYVIIVGKTGDGAWVGVKTLSVET